MLMLFIDDVKHIKNCYTISEKIPNVNLSGIILQLDSSISA